MTDSMGRAAATAFRRRSKHRLVVVGNGMAGARLVEDLIARGAGDSYDITVFGDEPHGNYNRILLSSVLAGHHRAADIVINPPSWYAANDVTLRAGVRVDEIDLRNRLVVDARGRIEPYDTLVIATGSRPFVPPIDGLRADGVFVFRTIDDCDRILAYAQTARRAAVIGGGLLGLEAARGLINRKLEVHVVHLMPHVMETQLDAAGAGILRRQLERMGLRVHFERRTAAVVGGGRVTGLAFEDGSTLACDMVVIAAGITPNVELAARAGLRIRRGILVDDDLACLDPCWNGGAPCTPPSASLAGAPAPRSAPRLNGGAPCTPPSASLAGAPAPRSAPRVYAIGECAEHRGQVYGLVAPLWEQVQVLADRLSGRNPDALYTGSRVSTRLKVAGVDLAVMGSKEPAGDGDEIVIYAEPSRGIYKKLIVRDDRLIGAIVMGDGAIVPSLLTAFGEAATLSANRAELLFPLAFDAQPPTVDRLPDAAQICDCNAVSKARIVQAVLEGARGLDAVCSATRAGTGCRSCRPEVQAIVEHTCRMLDAAAPADLGVSAGLAARADAASAGLERRSA